MRDWKAFVRERLRLPGLPPERESHIVRDLAAQLEDFYREALAGGASEHDADVHACRQIGDWDQLTRDVRAAERARARPRVERLADRIVRRPPSLSTLRVFHNLGLATQHTALAAALVLVALAT